MEKWFNDKFEKRKIRRYTRRRIRKPNPMGKMFRKLSVTNWLIIANFIVFIVFMILIAIFGNEVVLNHFTLTPNSFFSGEVWPLITSMFSHIWVFHIIFNMISLFFIGNFLERIIGRKRFLLFYIVSGLFAGLFYAVLSFYLGTSPLGARVFGDPTIPSLGASGAIFAIAGLLAMLIPKLRVYLVAGPIIAIVIISILEVFPIPETISTLINILFIAYLFISISSVFSFNPGFRKISFPIRMPFWVLPIIAIVPLVIIGLFVVLPIGNMAHLGGLIAGLIYGGYLKNRYPKKTVAIRKYFSR
jgi:membrane associated rhomboid family serine protease